MKTMSTRKFRWAFSEENKMKRIHENNNINDNDSNERRIEYLSLLEYSGIENNENKFIKKNQNRLKNGETIRKVTTTTT